MSYSLTNRPQSVCVDSYPAPRLFCNLYGLDGEAQVQQRCQAIAQLNFTEGDLHPALHDATQMAARFLRTPISVLSLVDAQTEQFKATHGLSQLGLTSPLTQSRQLDLAESFAIHIVDSGQPLVLADIAQFSLLGQGELGQTYGIRAYAGVPLITVTGCCIGALAVLDQTIHPFSRQDIAFLEMTARWVMAEQERQVCAHLPESVPDSTAAGLDQGLAALIDIVKLHLISQLTQDLRSPLTSVMGMASMLNRQIYGPLTNKQQEYTDIIRSSSQTLMVLVDEIIELGSFDHTCSSLLPSPVDIEMLGLQIINAFEQIAERHHQTLQMTIEPGERIWVLDRSKVKQILYHLLFSISQMAGENTTIRIHASRKEEMLNLAVWLSNPWMGDGLPPAALRMTHLLHPQYRPSVDTFWKDGDGTFPFSVPQTDDMPSQSQVQRDLLGLLLSQHIATLHQGRITIQGTPESGFRFVVELPPLDLHSAPAPSSNPEQATAQLGSNP